METEAGYREVNRLLWRAALVLRLETMEQCLGEGLTRYQTWMHVASQFVRAAQQVVRKVEGAEKRFAFHVRGVEGSEKERSPRALEET